jgi:hypothetical protein
MTDSRAANGARKGELGQSGTSAAECALSGTGARLQYNRASEWPEARIETALDSSGRAERPAPVYPLMTEEVSLNLPADDRRGVIEPRRKYACWLREMPRTPYPQL